MSDDFTELQAKVDAARANLENALDQVVDSANPRTQLRLALERLKESALQKVEKTREFYAENIKAASEGDRDAILTLAATAAAVVGGATFVVWRISQMTTAAKHQHAWEAFTKELGQLTPPKDVEFTIHSVDDPT